MLKHATSVCTTAEVWNLLAKMLRYSGYLDKGFFHNLEQCPNEFKHIKKLQKINNSTFKTCCIISISSTTKCHLLHNFIYFCSNNTFSTNYALKLKQPTQKDKGSTYVFWNTPSLQTVSDTSMPDERSHACINPLIS
jgi:phosphoserine aminotransferase